MGKPIPYRSLAFVGVQLAVTAGGLFWWATFAQGRGGIFVSGLGFLAASGVLACILLGVYQSLCVRRL